MGRLDALYGDDFHRPKSGRLGSLGKMALNKVGEEVLKSLPDSSGFGIMSQIYNSLKRGYQETLQAGKHKHGRIAFENNIPGLRKIVQNGWSLYHLKDGLTTINNVYTVERGGEEYMIHIEADGETTDISKLSLRADKVKGKEAQIENNLYDTVGRSFVDEDAVEAKVYFELTDGDIANKGFVDLNRLPPLYRQAELWLFGKGGGSVVGTASDGSKIKKYAKPAAADFLKFYGRMDIMYSALSATAVGAEKTLSQQAAQNLFTGEAEYSIEATKKLYGGGTNPLAPHALYRDVA